VESYLIAHTHTHTHTERLETTQMLKSSVLECDDTESTFCAAV